MWVNGVNRRNRRDTLAAFTGAPTRTLTVAFGHAQDPALRTVGVGPNGRMVAVVGAVLAAGLLILGGVFVVALGLAGAGATAGNADAIIEAAAGPGSPRAVAWTPTAHATTAS